MGSTVPSESIRVFLLIENRLLREALVRLFRKRSDLTVVGQSWQADLNVQQVLDSNCDVLVVASFQTNCLPASITLECIGQLSLKVVLIGMDCDEEQFLARYPLGKEFRMELTVRVIDQAPSSVVSEQAGRVN